MIANIYQHKTLCPIFTQEHSEKMNLAPGSLHQFIPSPLYVSAMVKIQNLVAKKSWEVTLT